VLALAGSARAAHPQDSVPPEIATFAREHGGGSRAPTIVAGLASPSFTLFTADTGASARVGVRARGRIGWLRQPATLRGTADVADTLIGTSWFDLYAGDSVLAMTAIDPRLATVAAAPLRVWRVLVAQSAVTPAAELLALLRADPTLAGAVATSPRLLDRATPVATLLALADASDAVGLIVVRNPRLADRPRALAELAERHAALWAEAMRRALARMPLLVASGAIDERLAVHLAFASRELGLASARMALGRLPDVGGRPAAAAAMSIAICCGDSRPTPPRHGLEQLIARLRRDTLPPDRWLPDGVGDALTRSDAVRADRAMLWAIATIDGHAGSGRWRIVRAQALGDLAAERATPLDDLRRVAQLLTDTTYWRPLWPDAPPRRPPPGDSTDSTGGQQWWTQRRYSRPLPEDGAAEQLMRNPRSNTDRNILGILAALPVGRFGAAPRAAQERLATLPPS